MVFVGLTAGGLVPLGGAEGLRFEGGRAFRHTATLVGFGPRTPGSSGHRQAVLYLESQLRRLGYRPQRDEFEARTPAGVLRMTNLVACRGQGSQMLVVSGHYDTKKIPGTRFIGANDGGSSAGFLLELARVAAGKPWRRRLCLVWFDGEEAFENWGPTDGLYGSRNLAARWQAEGRLAQIAALINVDMIGDRDLHLQQELNSTGWLRELVWRVAGELGYAASFDGLPGAIEDDHIPFLERGVPALDLIDLLYGPANAWWHTAQDTLDKLSAQSFQVVGDVVWRALEELDGQGLTR